MVKSDVLVSVIIPVYNASNKLSRMLDSVLAQTQSNFEVIAVDDGSTDDSLKVLRIYERQDSRIKVVSQENGGASSARNTGITHARGQYLMFFDADDSVAGNMIEMMVAGMKDGESLAVTGMSIGDKEQLPKFSEIHGQNKICRTVLTSILTSGLMYSPCNKIYSASIIRDQRISFDVSVGYGEDLIFNLSYLKHTKHLIGIPQVLYYYDYSQEGSSYKTARSMTYRRRMRKALHDYSGRGVINGFLCLLIWMRWSMAVIKARLR